MHKWWLNYYSFIWMLIRLTSLIFVWKFFWIFGMSKRLVRSITTKIREYYYLLAAICALCILIICYLFVILTTQRARSWADQINEVSRSSSVWKKMCYCNFWQFSLPTSDYCIQRKTKCQQITRASKANKICTKRLLYSQI